MKSESIGALVNCDILHGFTASEIAALARIATEATLAAGDQIFLQGSQGQKLFIIVDGEVELYLSDGGHGEPAHTQTTLLAALRRGQSFGEIALLDEGLRSASARAVADGTTLIELERDDVIRFCEANPMLGYKLMRNLAQDLAMKLRYTDLTLSRAATNSGSEARDS
jgi:CRP/FNR family transcriptional regulator, cyclic AMP receptor protein